jgi:hypothetical protein
VARSRILALALAGWLSAWGGFPPRAEATLRALDLSSLVRKSEWILRGVVRELESYRTPWGDFGEIIFTRVTVEVEAVIAGEWTRERVVVEVPGGRHEGLEMRCHDAPAYRVGEEVLLFLRRYNGAIWNVGWRQGKYTIERDPVDSAHPDSAQPTVAGAEGLPIAMARPLAELSRAVALLHGAGSTGQGSRR